MKNNIKFVPFGVMLKTAGNFLLFLFLVSTDLIAIVMSWIGLFGFGLMLPWLIWSYGLWGAVFWFFQLFLVSTILHVLFPLILLCLIVLTVVLVGHFGFWLAIPWVIASAAFVLGLIKWDSAANADVRSRPAHSAFKAVAWKELCDDFIDDLRQNGGLPSEEQVRWVKETIACHVNDIYGGHNWKCMRFFNNPNSMRWIHRIIGDPDTTVSSINRITSAFKSGLRGELSRKYWFRYTFNKALVLGPLALILWYLS
jgi:hypothetical protein